MMISRHIRSRAGGFTILELLLSMTLTAVLLVILSAGLYTVVNDWQRETGGLDEELDTSLVVLQLERALSGAFPHSYIDRERLSLFVYFSGDEQELRFVSTVSPQRHNGLTAWNLISDSERGLQLKLTPAFSDNPDQRLEKTQARSLLPNYEARFRYLVQRNSREKEWLDEWPDRQMQSLPLAVEVSLLPINSNSDAAELKILAPIKANQHANIEATIPAF